MASGCTYRELRELLSKKRITFPTNEMFLGDLKIYESPRITDEYTEKVVFPGHPFVQWLAKFFNFDPNVTVFYVRNRPKRSMFMYGNSLIMHPEIARSMRSVFHDTSA